jgi:hypothetical protein
LQLLAYFYSAPVAWFYSALDKFAYFDTYTRSYRLWRYAKNRPPYGNASPTSATRIPGYFAHPQRPEIEREIENRLNDEIESPVHKFLPELSSPHFQFTEARRRKLARYVTLLFIRSEARRASRPHTVEIVESGCRAFLSNDEQVVTVDAQWNLIQWTWSLYFRFGFRPFVQSARVRAHAQRLVRNFKTPQNEREAFTQFIRDFLNFDDANVIGGEWRLVYALQTNPFLLSDAPVVTWKRTSDGTLQHGIGFAERDVEVLLPVSPNLCLHLIPRVTRSRVVTVPTVKEINHAEVAFAARAVFADRRSDDIDRLVQDSISKVRFGNNAFTLRHRNYDDAFFNIFMATTRKP